MTQDSWGEVLNSQETYDDIALALSGGRSVIIGWTDEQMSHFDILFHYKWMRHPENNQIQGGIDARNDLFVSIMRKGAFGFDVNETNTHSSYYGEKLNMGNGITVEKLAELINGVKKALLNI